MLCRIPWLSGRSIQRWLVAGLLAAILAGLIPPPLVADLLGRTLPGEWAMRTAERTAALLPPPQVARAACSGFAVLVSNSGSDTVQRFNGVDGSLDNTNFITGLNNPNSILLMRNGSLLVSNSGTNTVKRYNAYTGVAMSDFITATGGLNNPQQMALGPSDSNSLYVVSRGNNGVRRFNATTGALLGVVTTTVPILSIETSVNPVGVAVDRSGNLYVSGDVTLGDSYIRKYLGGASANDVLKTYSQLAPDEARGLTVGPDGFLYANVDNSSVVVPIVNTGDTGRVERFNLAGTPYTNTTFINLSNLRDPTIGIKWGPDGNLYVVDARSTRNAVYVYNSTGTTLIRTITTSASPTDVAFVPCAPTNIVVRKETNPAGVEGTFPFTSNKAEDASFSLSHGQSYTLTNVFAGTYAITETVLSNYVLSSATCTSGTPAAITISSGQTITCTFVNRPVGTLIVKKIVKDEVASFAFSANVLTTAGILTPTFTLADRQSIVFSNVITGTYNIAETLPAGWKQTSAACDNGTTANAVLVAHLRTVTCTLVNERLKTNLRLDKTVSSTTYQSGDTLVYTITLVNEGPDPAVNVVIGDALPGAVTLQSSSASIGSYSAPNWTIPSAPVGTHTLVLTVTVN